MDIRADLLSLKTLPWVLNVTDVWPLPPGPAHLAVHPGF